MWRDLPGVSLVSSGNSRASSILTSVRYAIGGCLTIRHPGNAPVTAPGPTCLPTSADLLLHRLGPVLSDVFEVPSHKTFSGALVVAHDRGEQWPVLVG
jgi:hypothetical protein